MKKVKKKQEFSASAKEISFAKYISKLRAKRNLTQKDLADLINVSDRTISKWENGLTVPDLINIRAICRELGVSANSVILESTTLLDRIKNIFYLLRKLSKHIFNNIFKVIFAILFILLLIYFINNYNTISIYTLNYDSDDITIGNGYFIRSKARNVLMIDDITLNQNVDESTFNLELYTIVNGDKIILYESNNLNDIFLEELNGYPEALSKDVINAIIKNLYIEIEVVNEIAESISYNCSINFTENFSNNKLIYSNYVINDDYNLDYKLFLNPDFYSSSITKNYRNFNADFLNVNLDNISALDATSTKNDNNSPTLEDLGYVYDEKTDTYTKIDDDKNISYKPTFNLLIITQTINGTESSMYYYIDGDKIYFDSYNNNKVLNVKFKYFVSEKLIDCVVGNCENYQEEIDYILAEYQRILTTL